MHFRQSIAEGLAVRHRIHFLGLLFSNYARVRQIAEIPQLISLRLNWIGWELCLISWWSHSGPFINAEMFLDSTIGPSRYSWYFHVAFRFSEIRTQYSNSEKIMRQLMVWLALLSPLFRYTTGKGGGKDEDKLNANW